MRYVPPPVPPRSLARMVELFNSVVSLIGPMWANQGVATSCNTCLRSFYRPLLWRRTHFRKEYFCRLTDEISNSGYGLTPPWEVRHTLFTG